MRKIFNVFDVLIFQEPFFKKPNIKTFDHPLKNYIYNPFHDI